MPESIKRQIEFIEALDYRLTDRSYPTNPEEIMIEDQYHKRLNTLFNPPVPGDSNAWVNDLGMYVFEQGFYEDGGNYGTIIKFNKAYDKSISYGAKIDGFVLPSFITIQDSSKYFRINMREPQENKSFIEINIINDNSCHLFQIMQRNGAYVVKYASFNSEVSPIESVTVWKSLSDLINAIPSLIGIEPASFLAQNMFKMLPFITEEEKRFTSQIKDTRRLIISQKS